MLIHTSVAVETSGITMVWGWFRCSLLVSAGLTPQRRNKWTALVTSDASDGLIHS